MFPIQWTTDLITLLTSATVISLLVGAALMLLATTGKRKLLQQALDNETKQNTLYAADNQNLHSRLAFVEDQQAQLKQELKEKQLKIELLSAADALAQQAREQIDDLKQQLTQAQEQTNKIRQEKNLLDQEQVRLATELAEREASHKREVDNFEKQKAQLTEHFKVLTDEVLEAKSKHLQETSKLSLNAVMTPFQQSIESFKKEVQDIHHRETSAQGELKKELESLKELNQKITAEAHELSTALRGQKKLQGNWGELILENVLDRSGLQKGQDYDREVSFTTEEGRQRPDAIVYLPQGKHLVIDAKVSLNAYTRYVNAEDENERTQALREHCNAIADRIKELSQRNYYALPGLNSPDMVFMFIPIESAFVEALKYDESLFQKAIEQNVLVATPTTLLTSLNIVRQLWRFEDQNKHTAALAAKAEAVFKKLNSFLGSFEKIKIGLGRANDAYTQAEGQLISGRGNLVKQVGEFKNLAPSILAELPQGYVDKAELEVDFISSQTESEE